MRRPVSTPFRREALEGAAASGAVRRPADPHLVDHAQPGAAGDADRMGMVAAARQGARGDRSGPGMAMAGLAAVADLGQERGGGEAAPGVADEAPEDVSVGVGAEAAGDLARQTRGLVHPPAQGLEKRRHAAPSQEVPWWTLIGRCSEAQRHVATSGASHRREGRVSGWPWHGRASGALSRRRPAEARPYERARTDRITGSAREVGR